MTTKNKIHDCPYLAATNKCVHKSPIKRLSAKKRLCGYKHPENCRMYLEWQELRIDDLIEESVVLDPLNDELKLSGAEREKDI